MINGEQGARGMMLEVMDSEQQEKIKSNTPCYVFDERHFYETIRQLRDECGQGVNICFSIKSNPWLAPYIEHYVDQVEVCSEGELELCERAGINMGCILAGGVSKSLRELVHMIRAGVGMISIESRLQLELLEQACRQEESSCRCLLRVSSGNQFGMPIKEIKKILSERKETSLVRFAGLHYYSGTQKRSANEILKEMDALETFADEIGSCFDKQPFIMEYGPGIGYPYFITDKKEYHREIIRTISKRCSRWAEKYHFVFEAGRICASEAGDYITKVVDIKRNEGKLFYIVDGGCHQLKYYNQSNGYRIPYFDVIHIEKRTRGKAAATVNGSLCTAGDVLMRDAELEECDIGDLFVFHNVGAYSSTEAMALFLSRKYPGIFVWEQNRELKQIFQGRVLL